MMITTKAAVNAAETKPICALDPEKKKNVNIFTIHASSYTSHNFKTRGGSESYRSSYS